MRKRPPVALIILDGFALRPESEGNAVTQAKTPNFDNYWKQYPHATLRASGEDVGLPPGQMGNSEVGHMNIGAGRIVYQSLSLINKAIETGAFFENEAFLTVMKRAKTDKKALHLYGLLSDGGVHSHIDHLLALLQLAKSHGLTDVYVHGFLDGRDVGQKTAKTYIRKLNDEMKRLGVGTLASIHGRYYAMDRDQRWERMEKTYRTLVYGEGIQAWDPLAAVDAAYEKGVFDEFIEPIVLLDQKQEPCGLIREGDTVISYNFRPDRAIQISEMMTSAEFSAFQRGDLHPSHIDYVTMTAYKEPLSTCVAFPPMDLQRTLGETISKAGFKQLRIAETEKYPHVTFFLNGGRNKVFDGEDRILIDSPKVATYDLKPEMSAYEVTEALLETIANDAHDAIVLNFANPDMVGHSGKLQPTIHAVEAVDECLGRIVEAIHDKKGKVLITADHGNADEVVDRNGKPMTTHTTQPVPVIVTGVDEKLRSDGILADLAPTMLQLLNISQPVEMTGKSLLIEDFQKVREK